MNIFSCKGVLKKEVIFEYTNSRLIDDIREHELGRIGEQLAKEHIMSQIDGIREIKELNLKGIRGVPFDLVAKYNQYIWLIEVKTSRYRFAGVSITQKKRMKIILEMIFAYDIRAIPVLCQIKLISGQFRIQKFNMSYNRKGHIPNFQRIVLEVINYSR